LEAGIRYGQKMQQQQRQELQTADPMAKFMYVLKAKVSKRQYPRRFKAFLDFLGAVTALALVVTTRAVATITKHILGYYLVVLS
jgi:hypothetical protein